MEQHTRIFKKCPFLEFFQKTLKDIYFTKLFLNLQLDFYLIFILIYVVVRFLEFNTFFVIL